MRPRIGLSFGIGEQTERRSEQQETADHTQHRPECAEEIAEQQHDDVQRRQTGAPAPERVQEAERRVVDDLGPDPGPRLAESVVDGVLDHGAAFAVSFLTTCTAAALASAAAATTAAAS